VLISDPPYGIEYRSGSARTHGVWEGGAYANRDASIAGDGDGWAYGWIRAAFPDAPAAVFASWKHSPPWPDPAALLIWDKGEAFGMGDLAVPWKPNHEPIWVYGKGWHGPRTTSVLRGWEPSRLSMGRSHPHQKPVPVLAELVGKAPPGLICDPFAGTGSTLVAARLMGRRAIGVEMEERYCEVAAQRLAQGVLP